MGSWQKHISSLTITRLGRARLRVLRPLQGQDLRVSKRSRVETPEAKISNSLVPRDAGYHYVRGAYDTLNPILPLISFSAMMDRAATWGFINAPSTRLVRQLVSIPSPARMNWERYQATYRRR